MKRLKVSKTTGLVLLTAAFLCAGSVYADKPSWAGGGKHEKYRQKDRHQDRHHEREHYGYPSHDDRYASNFTGDRYFIDRHRVFIRDYYNDDFRRGNCPPGLAKKHNGCMPPGQAKKWMIGRPLPHDVIYYDLPPALAMGIGLPPPGYRFVRVASDILMIAIGTGMVMDAIQDLGMR